MMNWVYIRDVTLTPRIPVNTNAMINMNVAKAGTPPVQAQAQRPQVSMGADSAGRASTPPVVGNQSPQMVVKPPADAHPAGPLAAPAAPGTKHPKEEVLKSAYKQI